MPTAAFKLLCNEQGEVFGVESGDGHLMGEDMEDITVKTSPGPKSGLTVVEATMYDVARRRCCWRLRSGVWVCVQC
jgi:hypothetical protein